MQLQTPLGPLEVATDNAGAITRLCFVEPDSTSFPAAVDVAERLQLQLDEYFGQRRRIFDIPVSPFGTPFQHRVWDALMAVPYGTTTTYGELAGRLGDPNLVRAVGRANGSNPIAILIPCHRVIGADGDLVGYAAGIERKQTLLELEGALGGQQLSLI